MHEADLVRGICGAHKGYEIVEVCHALRTVEGRGLREGPGKKVDGVFPGRPHKVFGIHAEQ